MTIVHHTRVILLLFLSIGVCHIYYFLYLSQRKTFRNSTKTSANTIIKEAIDISNKIIDLENALSARGLLPNYSHGAEWYRPSQSVDYGDGTCDSSGARSQYKDLMHKWKNISETYKIPSFLYAGSLIGAARNADSVPWDGDMDVLVDGRFNEVVAAIADERDFDRYDGEFHLVIQEDFRQPTPEEKIGSNLYYTEHRRRFDCTGKEVPTMTDICAFQEPFGRLVQNGHHLDLYDYHYKEDIIYASSRLIKNDVQLELRDYHYKEHIIYTSSNDRFPLYVSFPLKRCMFLDMEMLCPQQTLHFLNIIYGPDVMNPEWRCSNGRWIRPSSHKSRANGSKIGIRWCCIILNLILVFHYS